MSNDITQICMGAEKKPKPATLTRTNRQAKLVSTYVDNHDYHSLLAGLAQLALEM